MFANSEEFRIREAAHGVLWLSDAALVAIDPILPQHQIGVRRVGDPRVISGILRVLEVMTRFRDANLVHVSFSLLWGPVAKRGVDVQRAGSTCQALQMARRGVRSRRIFDLRPKLYAARSR